MQFCMQSDGSRPKKAHVVRFRMFFLIELRGAFSQSARAESCTFPLLTISSPFEPGLPRPAGQPASQPEFCMHDHSTDQKNSVDFCACSACTRAACLCNGFYLYCHSYTENSRKLLLPIFWGDSEFTYMIR